MYQQILSAVVTGLIMAVPSSFIAFVVSRSVAKSSLEGAEAIIERYAPAAKQLGSLLGNKSVDSRQMKTAEKMVMKDVMAQEMPEMEVIKGYLSGDTLAYLEENPQVLPALYKKYAPLLEGMASKFMGNDGKKEAHYDV